MTKKKLPRKKSASGASRKKVKREPIRYFSESRRNRFYNATRNSLGQFTTPKKKAREIERIEAIRAKNPGISLPQINKLLHPPPEIFRTRQSVSALDFYETFSVYEESSPLVTVIDLNGQKFSYDRRHWHQAESLIELNVGNMWREASRRRRETEARQKRNKKKITGGNYIPSWIVETDEIETGQIIRVLVDFSVNNLDGNDIDLSQFKQPDNQSVTQSDNSQTKRKKKAKRTPKAKRNVKKQGTKKKHSRS